MVLEFKTCPTCDSFDWCDCKLQDRITKLEAALLAARTTLAQCGCFHEATRLNEEALAAIDAALEG